MRKVKILEFYLKCDLLGLSISCEKALSSIIDWEDKKLERKLLIERSVNFTNLKTMQILRTLRISRRGSSDRQHQNFSEMLIWYDGDRG
jgi:hypothetical protein